MHGSALRRSIVRKLCFPYYGLLQHYTFNTIDKIYDSQENSRDLIAALYDFKVKKREEIDIIRVGSTVSAAATIGSMSWPDIAERYWLAKYLWYTSLYMAMFALVSSSLNRQLDCLPQTPTDQIPEEDLRALLSLMLIIPTQAESSSPKSNHDGDNARSPQIARLSKWKKYWWQHSMMLMSWSWVFYLLGLTLYVLSPFITDLFASKEGVASFVVFLLSLMMTFTFTATALASHGILDEIESKSLLKVPVAIKTHHIQTPVKPAYQGPHPPR